MDAFALLGEPRRPWLDVDALKLRFLERSAPTHPDRFHSAPEAERLAATERYSELNAAFAILKEPRERLLHLYELEAGAKPRDIQRIPPGTMDLFVDVGQTCRDTDEFLRQKGEATSPMLKLKHLQEGLIWLERLQALQRRVNARRDELWAELQAWNAVWAAAPVEGSSERRAALPIDGLEATYRALSYVERWTGQLQERMVQLSL